MSKDKKVNIHVGTPGADETKKNLDGIASSAKEVGNTTDTANQQTGRSAGEAKTKVGALGKSFDTLKSKALGLVGGWVAIKELVRILKEVAEQFEKIHNLQNEIYSGSLGYAEIGQALEMQTGTSGKQQFWAEEAAGLQKAGALSSPGAAHSLFVASDIQFAGQGGIKNPAIRELVKSISPYVGAADLSGAETSKLLAFSGTAGIEPTEEAFKEYIAKLHAGYTSAKIDKMGDFLTGLQKGGTAYITQGGTLEGAIRLYSEALAVSSSPDLAATSVEQIARLAAGAYDKPVEAIERELNVDWSRLNMDQRSSAVKQYAANLPGSSRIQSLTEIGVPGEIAMELSKLVSADAISAGKGTAQSVSAASAADIEKKIESYLATGLAGQRQVDALKAMEDIKTGHDLAEWQQRVDLAKKETAAKVAKYEDNYIIDDEEKWKYAAFEELEKDFNELVSQLPEDSAIKARQAAVKVRSHLTSMKTPFLRSLTTRTAFKKGQEMSEEFRRLEKEAADYQSQTPTVPAGTAINNNHNYNNQMIINPVVGRPVTGARFTQD